MSDSPFNDPRFPDRPENPDFWKMADVVLQHDGAVTEGRKTIPAICAELGIDVESLLYMAHHRAVNFLILRGSDADPVEMVAAGWIDAFLAGVAYAKR